MGLCHYRINDRLPLGKKIELTNNAQFVLSKEEGGRLVVVQLVEN